MALPYLPDEEIQALLEGAHAGHAFSPPAAPAPAVNPMGPAPSRASAIPGVGRVGLADAPPGLDLQALADAQQADRRSALMSTGAGLFSRSASLIRGNDPGVYQPPPVPSEVRDYVQRRSLQHEDAAMAMAGQENAWNREQRDRIRSKYSTEDEAAQLELRQKRAQSGKIEADTAEAERQRTALNDPTSLDSQVVRDLAKRYKLNVPADTTGAALMRVLPSLKDSYDAEIRAQAIRDGRAMMMGGGGGAGGGGLSGDALDMAATLYARTGQLPSLGRNPSGRISIISRAAEMYPGSDIAANKGTLHSDSASLAGLQKQVDTVNAFERTALANLDRFEQEAGKTVDLGSPLANRPGRWLAENAGNPQVTRFNVARQVAVNEIGKILSGSMGNGGLSDSARHEVEQLLAGDASLAQLKGAADLLRQDMHNRRNAYEAELESVRTRMGGRLSTKGEAPAAAAQSAAPAGPAKISSDAEYDALPSGAQFVGPDGKVRRKR